MITFKPGHKGPGDMKIFWNGIQVEMVDIAKITLQLCKNEDIIFPKPRYRGGQMLIDLLQDVYNEYEISDRILREYRLDKYRPDKRKCN